MAQLVELWLDGPRGTCARYVVASGRQIIHDQTFDQSPVYCPVGVARCIETGSFWGVGFFDLLFSIHRQSETLKKALFNNVSDLDRYGFLVVPNGSTATASWWCPTAPSTAGPSHPKWDGHCVS